MPGIPAKPSEYILIMANNGSLPNSIPTQFFNFNPVFGYATSLNEMSSSPIFKSLVLVISLVGFLVYQL